jgi:hypothetical protein
MKSIWINAKELLKEIEQIKATAPAGCCVETLDVLKEIVKSKSIKHLDIEIEA